MTTYTIYTAKPHLRGGGQNESGLWTFTEDVFVGWMGCSCDVFGVLISSLY